MTHFVVGFEHKTLQGTKAQTLLVMAEAEADKEARIEERTQLLGLAPEAVKHPRHIGTQLSAQAKQTVEGFHAMYDKRLLQLLAQPYLLQEDFLLNVYRRAAQGIKAALADYHLFREVWHDEIPVRLPRVDAPSVATINNSDNIL